MSSPPQAAADSDKKPAPVRPRRERDTANTPTSTHGAPHQKKHRRDDKRAASAAAAAAAKAAPPAAPQRGGFVGQSRPASPRAHASPAAAGRPPFRATPSASSSTTPRATPASLTAAPPPPRLHHPFRANFNDHFETSTAALQDVLPVVSELRQLLRPSTPELFTLYDPYYCSGTVVTAWQGLGVQHVLHENRDFYVDVAKGTVPGPFDMLVTNPPFSEDHIWRLLDFLVTQQPTRPWAFVAPDYIASKPQYKAWVEKHFTRTAAVPSPGAAGAVKGAVRRPPPPIPSIASILPPLPEETEAKEEAEKAEATTTAPDLVTGASDSTAVVATAATGASSSPTSSRAAPPPVVVGPEPFYLVPRARYDYAHPLGVGNDHSHFKSMWYVWAGRHTSEVLRGVAVALTSRARGNGAPVVAVVNGYQALVEGQHVAATAQRLNPERRQRTAPERGGRRWR